MITIEFKMIAIELTSVAVLHDVRKFTDAHDIIWLGDFSHNGSLYRILKFDNKHKLDDSLQEVEKYIDRLAPVYYIDDDYELNFAYDIISLPERML